MSSATSPQQDRVIAQQRAHEPSMEEILASIRRIIADDQRAPARGVFDDAPSSAATLAPDRPANLDIEPAAGPTPAIDEPAFEPVAEAQASAAPEAEAAPDAEDDIIELTIPAPAFVAPAQESLAQASLAQASLAQASLAQASLAQQSMAPASAPVREPSRLISRETDAAVAAQFQQLAETMFADNARRVDDMTREMLRPMLKAWLDDNLPVLVERLVKAEIERVARGGR